MFRFIHIAFIAFIGAIIGFFGGLYRISHVYFRACSRDESAIGIMEKCYNLGYSINEKLLRKKRRKYNDYDFM